MRRGECLGDSGGGGEGQESLTFLTVALYWDSMPASIPSMCLMRSHTASVFMELSGTAGGTYAHGGGEAGGGGHEYTCVASEVRFLLSWL